MQQFIVTTDPMIVMEHELQWKVLPRYQHDFAFELSLIGIWTQDISFACQLGRGPLRF